MFRRPRQLHGIARDFARAAGDALVDGDWLVKTMRDGVLVVLLDPGRAIAYVARLHELADQRTIANALRIGMHHGTVQCVDDEVMGRKPNRAVRARVYVTS